MQSTDPAEATTSPISITVSAKLDDYPDIPAAVHTFSIEIVDPCETATIGVTYGAEAAFYSYQADPISFQS